MCSSVMKQVDSKSRVQYFMMCLLRKGGTGKSWKCSSFLLKSKMDNLKRTFLACLPVCILEADKNPVKIVNLPLLYDVQCKLATAGIN